MSAKNQANGQCLCGNVRIKASISKHVGACHCNMCRTWGGGPLMSVDCGSQVDFEGLQHVKTYDSSEWAERGFCSHCGTHLFYRLKHNQQHFIPAGLFKDVEGFVFDHQVFTDRKPAYYEFANKTQDMTEAEVFAKYAPAE